MAVKSILGNDNSLSHRILTTHARQEAYDHNDRWKAKTARPHLKKLVGAWQAWAFSYSSPVDQQGTVRVESSCGPLTLSAESPGSRVSSFSGNSLGPDSGSRWKSRLLASIVQRTAWKSRLSASIVQRLPHNC